MSDPDRTPDWRHFEKKQPQPQPASVIKALKRREKGFHRWSIMTFEICNACSTQIRRFLWRVLRFPPAAKPMRRQDTPPGPADYNVRQSLPTLSQGNAAQKISGTPTVP